MSAVEPIGVMDSWAWGIVEEPLEAAPVECAVHDITSAPFLCANRESKLRAQLWEEEERELQTAINRHPAGRMRQVQELRVIQGQTSSGQSGASKLDGVQSAATRLTVRRFEQSQLSASRLAQPQADRGGTAQILHMPRQTAELRVAQVQGKQTQMAQPYVPAVSSRENNWLEMVTGKVQFGLIKLAKIAGVVAGILIAIVFGLQLGMSQLPEPAAATTASSFATDYTGCTSNAADAVDTMDTEASEAVNSRGMSY